MRLRRQLFAATVHVTDETRRPITLTLAGLKFDIDQGEARQLAWDLVDAIDSARRRHGHKDGQLP